MIFLGLLSFLGVAVGVALASQATLGVAIVGVGLYFGICWRVYQARVQHQELLNALKAGMHIEEVKPEH